jgi:hypothetical protein
MGHEIVYCSGCQTRLRGPDAYHDAKGSWCAACAPPPQPLPAATPRSGSTLPRKKTARSVAPSRGAPAALLLGGGAGLLVLLVLAAALSSGNRPAPPPPPPGRPAAPPPQKPPPPRDLEPVARGLEDLLKSGADPAAVLLRCEAAAPELRDTPLEPRLRAVEAEAGRRKSAELEKKVDASLAQAREILASPTFRDREAELRAMLQAARGASDARRADVDRLLADLDRALAAPKDGLEILRVSLVDLATGKPVAGFDPFPDGATLDLAAFGGRIVDFRAQARGPEGMSVRFELTGTPPRIENTAPYDAGGTNAGPRDWAAAPGPKTLTVTPFPKSKATGTPGKPVSLRFVLKKP